MIRQEEPHYTREQVEQHLSDACDIMEAQGLTVDEHPALAVKVLELLAQKQIMFEQVQPLGLPGMAIPGARRH